MAKEESGGKFPPLFYPFGYESQKEKRENEKEKEKKENEKKK